VHTKIRVFAAVITLISQPAFADPLYDKAFYAGVLYERNRLSQQYHAMEDENARLQANIAELKEELAAQNVNADNRPQHLAAVQSENQALKTRLGRLEQYVGALNGNANVQTAESNLKYPLPTDARDE
jgi:hypothetical protein